MNKGELIKAIAEKTGLTIKEADSAVDALFEVVTLALQKGAKIAINGIGTFVLALIRGKDYKEAKAILDYSVNGSALAVKKVLMSAAANAENNMGMDKNDLYVAECFADGGQMLKRMEPVSKGRGHAILKRTSHITVILDVKKLEGEV